MTRRSKVWLLIAGLFLAVNVGGAIFAAAGGELLHSLLHVALVFPGAYLVWRLAPIRYARRIWHRDGGADSTPPAEFTDRLTHLEQSLDATAIEIERIGEGQRFMTRLFTEKGTSQASGEGAADPGGIKAGEAAPGVRRS